MLSTTTGWSTSRAFKAACDGRAGQQPGGPTTYDLSALGCRQLWTKHAPQAEQWLAEHPTHKGPNMSLTAMAESVLGRPLNKVMQCSNWAARPLSPMQLSYAALDAHASVQILSALQGQSRAAGQPLPDLQSSSSAWSSTPQTGSTGSAKARRRKRCSSEP